MTLRFIAAYEEFSTYRRHDGTLVVLEHGPGLVPWTTTSFDYDLINAMFGDTSIPVAEAQEFCAVTLVGPWGSLTPHRCVDCSKIDVEGSETSTGFICESCQDTNYFHCDWCGDLAHNDTTRVVGDDYVCGYCQDRYTSWCEHCDEYYHENNSVLHDHGREGCCEAPAQEFTIRNDGEDPLNEDERVTINLPAGVISDEGIHAMAAYLNRQTQYAAAAIAMSLDSRWQTKEGNFTKRLSRALYKQNGSKLAPEVMSNIGNIAREHSTSVAHAVEVTRNLNLPAEEFAHEDSCWWQSYASSRCALKSNGGFGLRSFNDGDTTYPTGRAWVMPLREVAGALTPTFDTMTPDAFMVFNGYGDLGGYTGARIMAHMAGMTYRKVNFSADPMFINSDSGYLVGSEQIVTDHAEGVLLHLAEHSNLHATETAAAEAARTKETASV